MKLKINLEGRLKLFFSLSLLVYATVVAYNVKNFLIATAMLSSTGGDIAIMASRGVFNDVRYKNSFHMGVIMFAVAHCLYITSMDNDHSPEIGVVAVISMLGVIMLAWLATEKGGKSELLMMACYAIPLIANAINSWHFNRIAGIGGIFFIVSDAILGLFEKKNPKWQIAIWVTYVTAQICLISSFIIK